MFANAKYLIKSGLIEAVRIHRNKPNKMQETSPNQDRPDFIKYSVSGSTFLLDALKCLEYKTPNSIVEFMEKQKFNCIIQNPPYVI